LMLVGVLSRNGENSLCQSLITIFFFWIF
jgi:hypothetical protein